MPFSGHLSYGALKDSSQPSRALPDLKHDSYDSRPPQDAGFGREWRRWLDRILVGALIIGASSAAFATFAGSRIPESVTQRDASFARDVGVKTDEVEARVGGTASMAPLEFSALNYYHVRDGQPGQLYPWLKKMKLIEPHRETILTVTNPSEGLDYRWILRVDGTDEIQASARGTEVAVVLTQRNEHVITLEEVNSAGLVVRHLEETVMVKYVRREIRTLTDVERGELLDSVRSLSFSPNKVEHGLVEFPNSIGEKPTVARFTYINRHTVTPKQRQRHTMNLNVTHLRSMFYWVWERIQILVNRSVIYTLPG